MHNLHKGFGLPQVLKKVLKKELKKDYRTQKSTQKGDALKTSQELRMLSSVTIVQCNKDCHEFRF